MEMKQNDSKTGRRKPRRCKPPTESQDDKRVTTYDRFVKSVVALFRQNSVAIDLYVGETSGHTGDDTNDDDLMSIIGTYGVIACVANTIYRKTIAGVNVAEICTDIYNDLHDFEAIDDFYWSREQDIEIQDMTAQVNRTIQHFHAGLRAYAKFEQSRGKHFTDDDNFWETVESPTLLRLHVALTLGDYDESHCEYPHQRGNDNAK